MLILNQGNFFFCCIREQSINLNLGEVKDIPANKNCVNEDTDGSKFEFVNLPGFVLLTRYLFELKCVSSK